MSVMPWDFGKAIGNNNYEQLAKLNPQIDTKHIEIQTNNKSTIKYMEDNLIFVKIIKGIV